MKFSDIVTNIISILQSFVVLIMGLALLYFLWGIVKYINRYGDETARKESVRIMTQGVIALFVMVSVWGLVALLVNFIGGDATLGIPQF
jgi:hypothetical protein